MNRFRTAFGGLLLALTLAGCTGSSNDDGPDTGFAGVWSRSAGQTESVFAIESDGAGGWSVCQLSGGTAPTETMDCLGGGRSVVRRGTDAVYELEYEARTSKDGDSLYVDIRGIPLTSKDSEYRSRERFTLSADGRRLWRWTLSVNGEERLPRLAPNPYDRTADRRR